MNHQVDLYLSEGCGRCKLYQTPACKVHLYKEPMNFLRGLLLTTELKEDYKWRQPCYTLNGKNVVILSALKDYCCLSFFKGSLMKDPYHLLVKPGENSQADRQLRFTTLAEVKDKRKEILSYIKEAIELEWNGAKVDFIAKNELELSQELIKEMKQDPSFKQAFESLTPGRQRGYNLYFSSAKKSDTRASRIEKYKSKIFEGKGWNEV